MALLAGDSRQSVIVAVIVLSHLVELTLPTPLPPFKQGFVLNEFIKHWEPAKFETSETLAQHHRFRRSASATSALQQPLRINFTSHHRDFRLLLWPDNDVFCDDVEFEDGKGRAIHFDISRAYHGTLQDEDDAVVKGVVTSDGLFDGTISTRLDDYFVEPVSRYLDAFPATPAAFHTVVYRGSDVRWPAATKCASQRLHLRRKKKKRRRRWLVLDDVEVSSSAKTVVNITSPDTVYHLANRTSLPDLPPRHDSTLNIRIVKVGPNSTIIRSTKTTDLVRPPPKILVGTGDEGLAEDDWLLTRQQQLVSKRAAVDERKTTCMLYLQADHLFYHKYGTEEACIEVMTRHVQRVNSIYKVTDFNQDGRSDNISFMIKRIKVHSSDAVEDPKYRFPGNYGVEKFLELFSEEDYDAFCLAYMFTYRDFEMGTLGLAWTGDLKNAGGVCEKNGHYRGSMKSLNTGIVTLLNYGKHVPPAVSHVTLAHEIGHNFGSPHDPEICTPGGEDGNFIMFARATSGDKKNNNKFSPCSLNSINPVLNVKARSPKGCFTEPQAAICGNGVVDPGEQCDCGWEEECRDACCYPQRLYPPPDEVPCRLTPNSMCSPSQGPCCTATCQLKFGERCRDDNGCRDSSYCDGRGPYCPPSINKPNKTVCNEEFVCFMGECTGSICLAYGLESCQCLPGPNDPPTKACELCCKLPGENQPCLSSFAWNNVPYDIPDMFSKPGTPCNDYNGYCDVFQKCREVDPSGPLATLRKLLLSEESIASFRKWITERWYLLILILFSVLFSLSLRHYIKHKAFGKNDRCKTAGHEDNTQLNNRNGASAAGD
ncbi:disintegrin and metalloproteinase domain-containing protein 10 isoform X2 [Nilaparvata lugens]|uniref:disintegrin and metalloproteinase domain-containing protein 10 isoform X2 n=1 Tax=Nilaparvata lugens TaxID=108931 RepID=UPI00193E2AF0|nr:disintegrin and metalloproteinase domain-containing protein 10 isoform X2 [Nilaparvata lugens]